MTDREYFAKLASLVLGVFKLACLGLVVFILALAALLVIGGSQ